MKEDYYSLERKLNRIIDEELEKDVPQIDDNLVMECCDGLLRMDDIQRYMISESEMKESIEAVVGNKKTKSVTRMTKSIKIILIAAIIAVLLAIGSLGYAQYKYDFFNFSDHSTVLFNGSDKKRVDKFEVGYLPEGFVLTYESAEKYECSREYVNGNDFFTVSKHSNDDEVNINTEHENYRTIHINGIDYVEFGEARHGNGIAWEKDGFIYMVSGNISNQELFKIAESVVYD